MLGSHPHRIAVDELPLAFPRRRERVVRRKQLAGRFVLFEIRETRDPAERKLRNESIATIREYAELRGRNAVWAELAISQNASYSADEALKNGMIDLIANDTTELLNKLNGQNIPLKDATITLHTTGMNTVDYEPNWQATLLSFITNSIPLLVILISSALRMLIEAAIWAKRFHSSILLK